MNLLTIGSFIFFTVLVAVISWYKTKDEDLASNSGYFLGGRSLTGPVIAGSLLLTNLSAEQVVGLNGNGFADGIAPMAFEVTSGITLVFFALYFLPRFLKSGFTTVPEYIEKRYDKGTRNFVTTLFLTSLTVVTLPIVLYSGGIALNSLFDVSSVFGVPQESSLIIVIAVSGVIGAMYAIFGGLKAVAVADTINGIGLLAGGLLIPILGFKVLGDGHIVEGMKTLIVSAPDKMNAVGASDSNTPFSTIFTGILLTNTFYWCTNQQIVQRAFGAKNLKEGQKGALYAGIIKMFVPIILIVPGVIAFKLYGSEITHQDYAYSVLVSKVLPKPLVGLFGAVIFGAVMSAFTSCLNSASTMFCLNVYKPIFNKNVSDDKLVSIGKVFATIVGVIAIIIAPNIAKAPNGLFVFMKSIMGFFNIPILVVVLIGFFTKKVPPIAAKVAIVFFMVTYSLYKFVFPININYLHIYGILFLVCIAIMLVIGKISPMKNVYEEPDTEGVVDMTPWKLARPISTTIALGLVYTYVVFSKIGILYRGENFVGRFWAITGGFVILAIVLFVIVDKHFNSKYKSINTNNSQDKNINNKAS